MAQPASWSVSTAEMVPSLPPVKQRRHFLHSTNITLGIIDMLSQPEVVGSPILMVAHRRLPLSSHSTIALSRCSSLRGTVLTSLLPRYRYALGEAMISAAQRANKPDHSAAHANSAGKSMQTSA